jgi:hypothetical protein
MLRRMVSKVVRATAWVSTAVRNALTIGVSIDKSVTFSPPKGMKWEWPKGGLA